MKKRTFIKQIGLGAIALSVIPLVPRATGTELPSGEISELENIVVSEANPPAVYVYFKEAVGLVPIPILRNWHIDFKTKTIRPRCSKARLKNVSLSGGWRLVLGNLVFNEFELKGELHWESVKEC